MRDNIADPSGTPGSFAQTEITTNYYLESTAGLKSVKNNGVQLLFLRQMPNILLTSKAPKPSYEVAYTNVHVYEVQPNAVLVKIEEK